MLEGSVDGVTWLPYEFKYKPGRSIAGRTLAPASAASRLADVVRGAATVPSRRLAGRAVHSPAWGSPDVRWLLDGERDPFYGRKPQRFAPPATAMDPPPWREKGDRCITTSVAIPSRIWGPSSCRANGTALRPKRRPAGAKRGLVTVSGTSSQKNFAVQDRVNPANQRRKSSDSYFEKVRNQGAPGCHSHDRGDEQNTRSGGHHDHAEYRRPGHRSNIGITESVRTVVSARRCRSKSPNRLRRDGAKAIEVAAVFDDAVMAVRHFDNPRPVA